MFPTTNKPLQNLFVTGPRPLPQSTIAVRSALINRTKKENKPQFTFTWTKQDRFENEFSKSEAIYTQITAAKLNETIFVVNLTPGHHYLNKTANNTHFYNSISQPVSPTHYL